MSQSRAAGDGFAQYWLHNGLVGLAGEKMSKSLGNSLLVDAVITQVQPVELRYYLSQAHYRSGLEYSPDALAEAVAAYRGIEGFVLRAAELTGPGAQDKSGEDTRGEDTREEDTASGEWPDTSRYGFSSRSLIQLAARVGGPPPPIALPSRPTSCP